jgi:hypothetical protein
MKSLNESECLEWANAAGLHLDPQYPDCAVLTFRDAANASRFWRVPSEPHRRPHFISALLELLGDWRFCCAWRHLGSWPESADPRRINDVVELQVLRGLGIPLGTADVVAFSPEELDKLVTLMFSTTIFGWSVGEDLYVVPDHARAFLQTDHHEVIHVVCREAGDVQRWIKGMEHEGFLLPDAVSDATLKIPSWIVDNDG